MITFVKGMVSPYVVLLVEVFLHLVLVLELLLVLQFFYASCFCFCACFCISSSSIIITSFAVSTSAESPISYPYISNHHHFQIAPQKELKYYVQQVFQK